MLERTRPVANSTTDGTPIPTPTVLGPRTESIAAIISPSRSSALDASVGRSTEVAQPLVLERRDGDLRPAHVDADQLAVEHACQLEAERGPAPSLQHVAHDNDCIPCVLPWRAIDQASRLIRARVYLGRKLEPKEGDR